MTDIEDAFLCQRILFYARNDLFYNVNEYFVFDLRLFNKMKNSHQDAIK